VSPAERLATIVAALEAAGLRCLVMGGHAVRYYGFERNTVDFDLHLADEGWDELPTRLAKTALAAAGPLPEGNSWRPGAFRRFLIGRLADGREEWLEFWRANHLLPPFPELYGRREEGLYGGRVLAFLSLADLIRSKETERESDWDDVGVLEEFLDARLFASVAQGRTDLSRTLIELRSRKGFERLYQDNYLSDAKAVSHAAAAATTPMGWAYLRPFSNGPVGPPAGFLVEPVVASRLETVTPASGLHLSLVELVRRQYKRTRQADDAADKQAVRAAQGH
jgi:hypothetical protein